MTYDVAFMRAMEFTLPREGDLSDDADDPGGVTNHGISLRWLRSLGQLEGDVDGDGDVDADDIRGLTPEQATALYHRHFWLRPGLQSLPQGIAICQFDAGVNCGLTRAVRILQEALCGMGQPVAVDGIFGGKTFSAVMSVCRLPYGEPRLATAMCLGRIRFYVDLAASPKRAKYLRGWVSRATDLASLVG